MIAIFMTHIDGKDEISKRVFKMGPASTHRSPPTATSRLFPRISSPLFGRKGQLLD